MAKKNQIINLGALAKDDKDFHEIRLDSGRRVIAKSFGKEDILEIREMDGGMTLRVRLTDDGPIFSVEGARLELKSPETISLRAKQVEIEGEEKTSVRSNGSLQMASSEEMSINSEEDLRLKGKMIHIN